MGSSFGMKFSGRYSMLSIMAPAIAALVFLTSTVPAQAATPPNGSYRQTCQDIKASSRILKARCQTRNRTYVRTSLAGYRDCRGDIANANGQLVCREIQGDITLYEHTFFRGRSLAVSSDVSSLPRWFNDAASSVRVRRGAWQVCADWSYRGRCEVIRRDIDNLNRIGLNDRISSLRRVVDRNPGGGGQYGPPQGSYQQSCRDVTFDGRYLTATCRDRRGQYDISRLDVRSCERGDDIVNRDGELVCDDRRDDDNGQDQDDNGGYNDGNNSRLPRGSYLQTCRNATIDRDMLRAECQDRNGNWRRSALNVDNCRTDIANDNGELRCTGANPPPPPPTAPLPSGSYQQSCRNMVFARGTLSGECRNTSGEWRGTSLDVRSCAQGSDIGNSNGQLTCTGANPPPPSPPPPPPPPPGGGPRPAPEGSYQSSCRNVSVERGTLNAECKDASGAWKQTSIEMRGCRNAPDIANDNGTLKCSPPPAP